MKSIKEKAAEYRRVIEVINEHESLVDTQGSEMFEAGANYVLDAIEDVLNHPRRYVNSNKSVEEGMIDALIKYVEQLKGNQ